MVRDAYWKEFPQRPWCVEEPSPNIEEGGAAIDVQDAIIELHTREQRMLNVQGGGGAVDVKRAAMELHD